MDLLWMEGLLVFSDRYGRARMGRISLLAERLGPPLRQGYKLETGETNAP